MGNILLALLELVPGHLFHNAVVSSNHHSCIKVAVFKWVLFM